MPHIRTRHLKLLVEKTLTYSPIVGIFGHRQVGKTTLAETLAGQYLTMDSPEMLSLATADPTAFFATKTGAPPLVIDECQLAAPLFPALKEWVRTHKTPGQFLLTGSVRFSSRKAIRESLTGRLIAWELLPMDWSEQYEAPLPNSLEKILSAKSVAIDLKPNPTFSVKSYQRYLETGGLPGVFGLRDPAIRAQRFETQINTLLERDLRLVIQTPLPFRTLRSLFVALGETVGTPMEITSIARKTRISLPTLRKLIAAFEALFLIRLVPTEGDFSKPILYFEDIGELHHLHPHHSQHTLFKSFLFQNLRAQFHYRPDRRSELFSFQTRAGHSVPLCFRMGAKVVGIIPVLDEKEIPNAHWSAEKFLEKYPQSKAILVGLEERDQVFSQRIRQICVSQLL